MVQDEVNYAFLDISVLIDYCLVHVENHKFSRKIINYLHENGAELVIGKEAGQELTDRIINRQRLFDYLFTKSSEYLKKYSEPTTQFKSDILNFGHLNDILPAGLNTAYTDEINVLRDYLDDVGMDRFRVVIDDFRRGVHTHQIRLENSIIDERYSRSGRDSFYLELAFESVSDDPVQVESMVDAIDWSLSKPNNRIFIRHSDKLYQNRAELLAKLPNHTTQNFNLISPKDALDVLRSAS